MSLDLTSLKKAIISLETSINIACSKNTMDNLNDDIRDTIKAGVIQNFEFTYELCWKFIQRWLKTNYIKEEALFPRTRKELFRMAAQANLITDPIPWFEYSDARNITAHTYSEDIAENVFNVAVKFINDAKNLLRNLEQKND